MIESSIILAGGGAELATAGNLVLDALGLKWNLLSYIWLRKTCLDKSALSLAMKAP